MQTPTKGEDRTRRTLTVAEVMALGLTALIALPALGAVLLILGII